MEALKSMAHSAPHTARICHTQPGSSLTCQQAVCKSASTVSLVRPWSDPNQHGCYLHVHMYGYCTCQFHRSRGGPFELEFLSQLLSQHKPRDVSSTLQTLPDYLGLPGSPSDYLPAEDQIPLQHAGVLDLHVYPMASTVTQQIMDSLPFRRQSHSTYPRVKRLAGTQPRAAFYLLCYSPVSGELLPSAGQRQQLAIAGFSSTEVIEVYQVHMPPCPWPPLPRSLPKYNVPSCCIMDEKSPTFLIQLN